MKLVLQPQIILRIPAFPLDATMFESWEELKLAIADSSPSFYRIIENYEASQLKGIPATTYLTLWKYFNRAKYRGIPYGRFASFGMLTLNAATENQIIIGKHHLHCLPDWSVKDMVGQRKNRNQQLIFSNGSYYTVGNVIRYISRFEGQFQLSEIEVNIVLIEILQYCSKPVKYDELVSLAKRLLGKLGQARKLINDLRALQLLIPEHHPNIIGEDFFKRIDAVLPDGHPNYIIAERPVQSGNLDQHLIKAIPALIIKLHKLKPKNVLTTFKEFVERFQRKFDLMEVSLMVALDPELGVGYDGLEQPTKTDDFVFQFNPKGSGLADNAKNDLNASYLRYVNAYKENNNPIIELDALKLPETKESLPLPNSISVMGSIINGLVWIDHIGGATTNSLLGRFTMASDEVLGYCKATASAEKEANPDVLFFDVAYMSEADVDNINRRRSIYDYQLSILNYDTSKDPLTLADMLISYKGNEIILRSRRLNKRLVPRLTTAYNYARSDLPVFRLLCDLQHQDLQTNLNLDFQSTIPDLTYYPRIQYRNFVLSPASWKISYQNITASERAEDVLINLQTYLNDLGVNRYFKTGLSDQTLLFDREIIEDLKAFIVILHKQGDLIIKEYDIPDKALIVDEKKRPYTGQFILSYTHDETVYKPISISHETVPIQNKIIPPGRDWLYFEIYCHPERTDELLQDKIQLFLKQNKVFILRWFFIRYNESGDHLRLRMQLKDVGQGYKLISSLSDMLHHEINSGIVADFQLRTYKRETERYGGSAITEVEQHFSLDSNYVMLIIKKQLPPFALYKLCSRLMDEVVKSGLFSDADFDAMINRISEAFNKEHDLKADLFAKLNAEYKSYRALTIPVLSLVQEAAYKRFETSFIETLKNRLPSSRQNLFGDLIHMHVNRLFNHRQRSHEMILYYFYWKDLQRKKKYVSDSLCNSQLTAKSLK